MTTLEYSLSLPLCVCVCISPRQSRGYDTSPLTRRKSYDRAYRYRDCSAQIYCWQISLWTVVSFSHIFVLSSCLPSFSILNHPVTTPPPSGQLTATPPPPPLLWGPGTTATSSQGSPATKPKVLHWTSKYIPARTHEHTHTHSPVVLLSLRSRLISSVSLGLNDPFLSFLLFHCLRSYPVDRLKVRPVERKVLLTSAAPAVSLEMNFSLRQRHFYCGFNVLPWGTDIHWVQVLNAL